jgi:hypothetical protein
LQRCFWWPHIIKDEHVDVFSLRAGDCFQNPSVSQLDTQLRQVGAAVVFDPPSR